MNKIKSEQIVLGFAKYLNKEILPCVQDPFTKIAIRMFAVSTELKVETFKSFMDAILKNQFVSEFFEVDENGYFNMEFFIDALRKAIDDCGELVVKIPPVKFLSPEEKILRFTSEDVSKLKQYLTNEIN